ncbi:1-deoxy-D-xylulose-5-phosphate synthase [candidate division WOR-3 bacterium]|nr:1-deoxy-D-xylulose-5-phosphate synthase [candidate division WOR-3 bacterium]
MTLSEEMGILEQINSPKDIKGLSIDKLQELAHEIREEIIKVVSDTGGHIAPSLGVVELTLALHYVFDTPRDKIIWDVGHQSYAHKLLTGRRKSFHTLRTYGGISGFPRIKESEYDVFGTGHSSTAISAGLGMAVARDLNKKKFKIIAVVGDGSLTAGISYEGLNQTGFMRKDMIVVLNDNGMSISKNVGGLARYLNKIVMTPAYTSLKGDVWDLLGKLPRDLSYKARRAVKKLKEGLKSFVVPTVFFEELGLGYIGPLDGHDLKILIENFKYAKKLKEPVLIHAITEKGRGYEPAVNNPSKFHGLGSFDKITGEPVKKGTLPTYSEVFGDTLIELAKNDKRIVAITAAMPDGTGLSKFKDAFPDRFFDVGIAEQHAVTFSAGLALQGLKPVCAIYSTFLQRGFDQVLHDVCLQKIPVVFAIDRAGIVGEDGPTHQGTFDLSYLNCIPDIVIGAPSDKNEFRSMLYTAVNYEKGPIAIRYPKGSVEVRSGKWEVGSGVNQKSLSKIKIGKAKILREGRDGVILAIGSMVYPALEAAGELENEGLKIGVVDFRFIKPLDTELLNSLKSKKIITIEENTLSGGFGSAVLEFFNRQGSKVNLLRIGLPDQFIEHGSRNLLLEKYGLVPSKIKQRVKEFLHSSK